MHYINSKYFSPFGAFNEYILQHFSVSPNPLGSNLGFELSWTVLGLGLWGLGLRVWG